MTHPLRTILLVVAATFILSGTAPQGETATVSFESGSELVKKLNSDLFSMFNVEEVARFEMCGGDLLLNCAVSSEYGWRIHPRRRRKHFHTGVDLAAPKGSPIFAPADGVVKKAGWGRGYGRMVELDHAFAWNTKYAHMKKIYVKKGQEVKKGDIIGTIGSSGVSTGPHLHFEILYFGKHVSPRAHFASLDTATIPYITVANR